MLVFNSSQWRSPSYSSSKMSGLFRGMLASPCLRRPRALTAERSTRLGGFPSARVSQGAGAALQCGSAGLYEGSWQEGLVLRSGGKTRFPSRPSPSAGSFPPWDTQGVPHPLGHLELEPGSSLPMPGTGSSRLEGAHVLPGRSPGMAMAELPCQGLRLLQVRASTVGKGGKRRTSQKHIHLLSCLEKNTYTIGHLAKALMKSWPTRDGLQKC